MQFQYWFLILQIQFLLAKFDLVGEFDFDVRLFCNCTPWNMNLGELSGIAKINVKEGVFTDKDPNIGRVLSLLNIRSIAKRTSPSLPGSYLAP